MKTHKNINIIKQEKTESKAKNFIDEKLPLIKRVYEQLSSISSIIIIAVSIFSIFILLMQIRRVNNDMFFLKHYHTLINVIVIFFVISFIEQIRLAPRIGYSIMAVFQIMCIIALNIISKKYDLTQHQRLLWASAGSLIFLFIAISNWMRLSYSKFTLSQMIISSFVFAIILGSLLLYLPLSTVSGVMSFLDSLFMATSAVCVTGLTVVDISKDLTMFGNIIILCLIQVGGLGIISISAILSLFLRGKGSVQDRVRTLEVFNTQNKYLIRSTIRVIFIATFLIELLGALVLYTQMKEPAFGSRLFNAIFHSISAFCNAGFALYTYNFHMFFGNTILVTTVCFLIIFGGIGYPVILTIFRLIKNAFFKKKRLALNQVRVRMDSQTRIVLFTTITLIILGASFIFFNEYNSALKDFNLKEKILVSVFQSVTTRTAGFETVSFINFSNITLGLMMILMFIGASPSGTGGGIKTTTVFIFISSVLTAIKNKPYIAVGNRKVTDTAVTKSVAIVTLALTIWFSSAVAIYYVEKADKILPIMFETVSALSTVGLSMNLTTSLSSTSRIILIALMFIGRVGYLTLFMSIGSVKNTRKYTLIDIPTENITIG